MITGSYEVGLVWDINLLPPFLGFSSGESLIFSELSTLSLQLSGISHGADRQASLNLADVRAERDWLMQAVHKRPLFLLPPTS